MELNLHIPVISLTNPDLNKVAVWCLSPKLKFSNKKFFDNVPLSLIIKTFSEICELELLNREIRIESHHPDSTDAAFLKLIRERLKPYKVNLMEDNDKYSHKMRPNIALYYMMKSDFVFKKSMGGLKYEEYMS